MNELENKITELENRMSNVETSFVNYQNTNQQLTFPFDIITKKLLENDLVKSTNWITWTPVLTWTTGTPATNVVTKLRYKILDRICFFSFYYKADDGNGATALTVSLPYAPRDNDSFITIGSQQKVDTTWSDPFAYIDDGVKLVSFRKLSACTDTKAVIINVSGLYEI
jgi:hypothetical protein